MAKRFPLKPANPHRICWGCDRYCPADSMACGNGSDRTQHPIELFGEDWHEWEAQADDPAATGPDDRPASAGAPPGSGSPGR